MKVALIIDKYLLPSYGNRRRVFTLMEFVVRRQLHQSQSSLAGLYKGNPKRATFRPTAEKMLLNLDVDFHLRACPIMGSKERANHIH